MHTVEKICALPKLIVIVFIEHLLINIPILLEVVIVWRSGIKLLSAKGKNCIRLLISHNYRDKL